MPQPLKHKMYEFEVTPPTAAWDAIAARLSDDAKYALISAKMTSYEVAPPTNCWNNITTSLSDVKTSEATTPVIKFGRKFQRYAAAAIIMGLVAGAGWLFLHTTVSNVGLADKTDKHPVETTSPKQINSTKEETQRQNNDVSGKIKEVPAITTNKNNSRYIAHSADDIQLPVLKYATVSAPSFYIEGPIVIGSPPLMDEKGAVIGDMDVLTTNNSYLVVAGPDGQLTRISSKFANVIRYLNGGNDVEEYLDRVIRESGIWKKRFQEWRNKISQSTFVPSSANFLDIMEFKELIDEKK